MEDKPSFFYENELRVLHSIARVMRWMWFCFPIIYLGNILKLFQIEYSSLNDLALTCLILLWLPTLVEMLGVSPRIRRYVCVVGMGIVVALIGTNENIGIYMTYALAMVMSLLFFDMAFTLRVSIISYLLIVGSLYLRAPGANHGEFETPMKWWISRSAGFLIEAVIMTAICTVVAKFSHRLLENLEAARKEAVVAEKKAMMTVEMQKERDEAEEGRLAAEKANKDMAEFIVNISREIKTPMNTIIGMDEQILKETSEEKTRECAESILMSGRMLLHLTDGLIDFADTGVPAAIPDTSEMTGEDAQENAINRDEGLRYASGKEEFYIKLLRLFKEQAAERKNDMQQAIDSGNAKSYTVLVHSLKSNSKMIGAAALSEKALRLEQVGKTGNIAKIKDNHKILLQEYDRVLEEIDGIVG